jgi:hypothetical protein
MMIVQVVLCLLVLMVPPGFAFTTTPALLYKSQHKHLHHGCVRTVSRTTVLSRRGGLCYPEDKEDKDDDETGKDAIDPSRYVLPSLRSVVGSSTSITDDAALEATPPTFLARRRAAMA